MLLFFGIPKLLLRTLRFLQVFMNVYPVPLGIHWVYIASIVSIFFVPKFIDIL